MAEKKQKSVQLFALTFGRKNGIINHKFIITAMKKRSICGGFSENRRLVRADNRNQRRALWSSFFTKRADANQQQPTRVEPRKIDVAFVPCFTASDEGFFSSLAKYIFFVGAQSNLRLAGESPFGGYFNLHPASKRSLIAYKSFRSSLFQKACRVRDGIPQNE